MPNIQRNEYRLYAFFVCLLALTISFEFAVGREFSYPTLICDGIFAVLFIFLSFLCRKESDIFGKLGTALLVLFILIYGWRAYEWFSNDNLFIEQGTENLGSKEAKDFLLAQSLKFICGVFGLMLQITVFTSPPEE